MGKVSPLMNIPNRNSQGSDWLEWYKILKSNFGKDQANALFLKAWHKQGDTYEANTHELRDYLSKNGINIEKDVISSVYDTGANVVDSVESFLGIGKTLVIVLGVTITAGIALAVFNIAKNPAQAIGVAAKAAI